ncbi:MAG TPA: hypothetical protein VLV83_12365 [Acidobacteriota bacterium]|nr:hypothetical protein [Acidobacteriota bacterium]
MTYLTGQRFRKAHFLTFAHMAWPDKEDLRRWREIIRQQAREEIGATVGEHIEQDKGPLKP